MPWRFSARVIDDYVDGCRYNYGRFISVVVGRKPEQQGEEFAVD